MLTKKELDERVNEVMGDIGVEAEEILKKKGMVAMTEFIDSKLDSYRAKWISESTPSIPLTGEALALREEIGKNILLRLRTGNTSFASNPIEAKTQWDRDPELRAEFFNSFDAYQAYRAAEALGQIRVSRSKVIR